MERRKYDEGYKRSLERKGAFLHFLKKYVKEPWTANLKEKDISLCSNEFVLADFTKRDADMVWKINLDSQDIYVYIIQEFQSEVDYTMPLRTLVYTMGIYLHLFRNTSENERTRKDFKLPVIIAIVFYNGEGKWNVTSSFSDYQKGYELFNGHAIDFNYYFIDLAEVDEEYILSSNTLLDNIFLVDKMKKEEDLLRVLKQMGPRIDRLSDEDMEEFAVWIKGILKKTFPNSGEIDDIVDNMKERKGDSMYVSSIERIYKRKLEQDLKEGVKKELQKGLQEEKRKLFLLYQGLQARGTEDLFAKALENEDIQRELFEELQIY